MVLYALTNGRAPFDAAVPDEVPVWANGIALSMPFGGVPT
jgi:hypothetical protein